MHIPVLKNEVIATFGYLKDTESPIFVDGTIGAAGHSIAITQNQKVKSENENVSIKLQIIGIDQDQTALKLAEKNIQDAGLDKNFALVHTNFQNTILALNELNIDKIDGALLDLGVSSMQLDSKERGFSFSNSEAPLDMRMDCDNELTAEIVLNTSSSGHLEEIMRRFGEEHFAKNIARSIVYQRKKKPLKTVGDLLEIIESSVPKKSRGRIHPATRTFQALRIEVNQELDILAQSIENLTKLLKPGGRLAVISFHSLEDRIVKQTFKELENPCHCPSEMPCICGKEPIVRIVTKKPIIPTDKEIAINPRSRSAKLRIVEKL